MLGAFVVAAALAAAPASDAQMRVVVVEHLDLAAVEDRGAVGLLVPGSGPRTSRNAALEQLVRGTVHNSLLGGRPEGEPLIRVETSSDVPAPPAIVLELPREKNVSNNRRYPIAVLGAGYRGVLVSERARLPGLVSIADVAPTALGEERALSSQAEDEAAAELAQLERRIDANNDGRRPVQALVGVLVVALALAAPAAALPGFASALATNLLLGASEVTQLWLVLVFLGAAAIAGGVLLRRLRPPQLGLALTAVLGAYVLVPAIDAGWLALSPLDQTLNSRFYGLSNLLSTALLAPSLAAAWLLGRRYGALAFAAVAALALVSVGSSRLGADGGGAVVLVAAFAVLALCMWRRKAVVPLAVGAAVAAVLLVVDALLGQSHVGDALRDGVHDDLARRLELSWARATSSWVAGAICSAGTLTLAALAAFGRRQPLLVSLLAGIGVSLLVNDSPSEVVLAGLVCYAALLEPSGVRPSELIRVPARR